MGILTLLSYRIKKLQIINLQPQLITYKNIFCNCILFHKYFINFCAQTHHKSWHHWMGRMSHLLTLRYWHIYAAKNKGNKKILTNMIKFIPISEHCNSGTFNTILKLISQGRGWYQSKHFTEKLLSSHFVVPANILQITDT